MPGESIHLVTGPLYHAAPLSLAMGIPQLYGASVVLMDGWDCERALQMIERHRVTHMHLVPTMMHRLLSLPEAVRKRHDLSSLQYILHGAAPCPPGVKRAMIDWVGPIVWEYYGATEGTGTLVDSTTWLARPGTVGRPDTPDHIRILDEAGQTVPPHGSRADLHEGAGERALQLLQGRRQDEQLRIAASTTRSATSAISMQTATCS